jgi:hypothetical protein
MGHPEPPVEYSGLAQQRRRAELDAAEEAERIKRMRQNTSVAILTQALRRRCGSSI